MSFLDILLPRVISLEEEPTLGGSDCNAVRLGPMAYEDIEV